MANEPIPRSGEYSEGNLWFERIGTSLTIGITSHGLITVGQIESIDLPDEDSAFKKGDVLGTIDGSGGQVEIVAPGRGSVTEINKIAARNPDRVMEDPVEEGWLVKFDLVSVDDLKELP